MEAVTRNRTTRTEQVQAPTAAAVRKSLTESNWTISPLDQIPSEASLRGDGRDGSREGAQGRSDS